MSSKCQCLFSAPTDTILGSHREPITSEKCWYDFAVRELSRLAAGKAKGQEAVWGAKCKPAWWDSMCPHPWKNPTANPKDSKDTLKVKFECLEQHLRKEGKIPSDIREEIELWKAGKYNEVFLMTSFSSILRQVSNAHAMITEAHCKMEEHGITINPCIFKDLQNCLAGCVQELTNTESLSHQNTHDQQKRKPSPAQGKRKHNEVPSPADNPLSSGPVKRVKLSPSVPPSSTTPPLSSADNSVSYQLSVPVQTLNPDCQKQMLNFLMKKSVQASQVVPTTSPTSKEATPVVHNNEMLDSSFGDVRVEHKVKMEKSLATKQCASVVNGPNDILVSVPASEYLHCTAAPSTEPQNFQVNDELEVDFLEFDLENPSTFDLMDRILEDSTQTISTNDFYGSKASEDGNLKVESLLTESQLSVSNISISGLQISGEPSVPPAAPVINQPDPFLTVTCPSTADWHDSWGFEPDTMATGECCSENNMKIEEGNLNQDGAVCGSDSGYSSDSSSSAETESMENSHSDSEISPEDMCKILSWMINEQGSSP